ncbi:MAG TPA: carotenoid oxygenase family protein [Pseudonocardiaceae bacterium]|nr:carotenoid oxygenase family protein [Pseudonocardiaceae bacterium]
MGTTLRYSCATDPNPVAEIDPLTYHWFMGDEAGTNNPGEFVFIPNTADAAEDDGVPMGFVYDASTNRSDLLLLDAATLETIAALRLPERVSHGFHGNWSPSRISVVDRGAH